jgi:hypothetical protein
VQSTPFFCQNVVARSAAINQSKIQLTEILYMELSPADNPYYQVMLKALGTGLKQ